MTTWTSDSMMKELVDEQNRLIEDLSKRLLDQEGHPKESSDRPEEPETEIQK